MVSLSISSLWQFGRLPFPSLAYARFRMDQGRCYAVIYCLPFCALCRLTSPSCTLRSGDSSMDPQKLQFPVSFSFPTDDRYGARQVHRRMRDIWGSFVNLDGMCYSLIEGIS
ncbi:hypothetical protein EJ04DRAFT_36766 [Polyplosphaeria fusca]|uniref:Uncharacterized protein n=1 Tax=Polyplosphaeria fusca TaxID=682080 RepID=A0A9P4QTJ8_9PLEO|nr:hypothetical protein EJ04DRAFT_36766 [Polyplosphaeria fusca]